MTAIGAIYHVGRAVDNVRYWNDYYRNTRMRARYPFRSGQFDYMSELNSAGKDATNAFKQLVKI